MPFTQVVSPSYSFLPFLYMTSLQGIRREIPSWLKIFVNILTYTLVLPELCDVPQSTIYLNVWKKSPLIVIHNYLTCVPHTLSFTKYFHVNYLVSFSQKPCGLSRHNCFYLTNKNHWALPADTVKNIIEEDVRCFAPKELIFDWSISSQYQYIKYKLHTGKSWSVSQSKLVWQDFTHTNNS